MNPFMSLINDTIPIGEQLGYQFKDPSLLALAFVHRSYINEQKYIKEHNERLEFLGDSVLGLIVASYLYEHFPDRPEGELSSLRSRLVNAYTCMHFVLKLNLHERLLLGKGERLEDNRGRESILGDFFEAIIGAIYLDGGLETARHFFFKHYTDDVRAIIERPLSNWKALFQDYCQKAFQQTPCYVVLDESGPDHNKNFHISVQIKEQEMGKGKGRSKKEAQQNAAENALKCLKEKNNGR